MPTVDRNATERNAREECKREVSTDRNAREECNR